MKLSTFIKSNKLDHIINGLNHKELTYNEVTKIKSYEFVSSDNWFKILNKEPSLINTYPKWQMLSKENFNDYLRKNHSMDDIKKFFKLMAANCQDFNTWHSHILRPFLKEYGFIINYYPIPTSDQMLLLGLINIQPKIIKYYSKSDIFKDFMYVSAITHNQYLIENKRIKYTHVYDMLDDYKFTVHHNILKRKKFTDDQMLELFKKDSGLYPLVKDLLPLEKLLEINPLTLIHAYDHEFTSVNMFLDNFNNMNFEDIITTLIAIKYTTKQNLNWLHHLLQNPESKNAVLYFSINIDDYMDIKYYNNYNQLRNKVRAYSHDLEKRICIDLGKEHILNNFLNQYPDYAIFYTNVARNVKVQNILKDKILQDKDYFYNNCLHKCTTLYHSVYKAAIAADPHNMARIPYSIIAKIFGDDRETEILYTKFKMALENKTVFSYKGIEIL